MIEVLGIPGSPYTRKVVAALRYARLEARWLCGLVTAPPPGRPAPPRPLLPVVYVGGEALSDSTPILRRLCAEGPRGLAPDDPALALLCDLVEDYADEWVSRPMFHYRWTYDADADGAAALLALWAEPSLDAERAAPVIDAFRARQRARLGVVGSNAATGPVIEASYERLLGVLDGMIACRPYLLGARPAACDFALHGQLSQLTGVDPTPAALTMRRAPRVRAWSDWAGDLSGVEPGGWPALEEAAGHVHPLLEEAGRTYAPVTLANAAALASGAAEVACEVDGRPWRQAPFKYQARCLAVLREAHANLTAQAQARFDAALAGTGCGALFARAGLGGVGR